MKILGKKLRDELKINIGKVLKKNCELRDLQIFRVGTSGLGQICHPFAHTILKISSTAKKAYAY